MREAQYFISFVQSAHGTAFLIGAGLSDGNFVKVRFARQRAKSLEDFGRVVGVELLVFVMGVLSLHTVGATCDCIARISLVRRCKFQTSRSE
eukprot:207559-Amphidinium_carterae.1